MDRVVCSWSGGKESTLALDELLTASTLDVAGLVTTVGEGKDRTSIHGVRTALLERQADALGLPIDIVEIPIDETGESYVQRMADVFADYVDRGIDGLVLGDVYVEDDPIDYRGQAMDQTGIESYCPLHGASTADLVQQFREKRYEAITVCVDGDLGREFVGRRLDAEFVDDLPSDVDVAGEDGEYHTFVSDGPIFERPVEFETGEVVKRSVDDGTKCYVDLVPPGEA